MGHLAIKAKQSLYINDRIGHTPYTNNNNMEQLQAIRICNIKWPGPMKINSTARTLIVYFITLIMCNYLVLFFFFWLESRLNNAYRYGFDFVDKQHFGASSKTTVVVGDGWRAMYWLIGFKIISETERDEFREWSNRWSKINLPKRNHILHRPLQETSIRF